MVDEKVWSSLKEKEWQSWSNAAENVLDMQTEKSIDHR